MIFIECPYEADRRAEITSNKFPKFPGFNMGTGFFWRDETTACSEGQSPPELSETTCMAQQLYAEREGYDEVDSDTD